MGPKKQNKNIIQEVQKEPEIQIPPHELTGYGRFEYLSGVIYEGRWKMIKNNKVKHGFGVLTISNTVTSLNEKQMYQGNWEDDMMKGYGVYYYSDGSIYEGQWERNKHHGRGLLTFANGTRYQGQWINHLMHGTGIFYDHIGRRWNGQYRNGVFESRMQTQLIKEKTTSSRKEQMQKQVLLTIENMIGKIKKSDKDTIMENISPFFVLSDDAKLLIKEPYAHYNDKGQQKWQQILAIAKNGSFNIISQSSQSKILKPEQILRGQLQGIGQIIQLSYEKEGQSINLVFLQKQISRWVIVAIQQNKK